MLTSYENEALKSNSIFIVTNMIAPYRIPLFNHLANKLPFKLFISFFTPIEKNRKWTIPYDEIQFKYKILPGVSITYGNYNLHFRLSLLKYLMLQKPLLVIISGFSLQTLITMFYAHLRRKPYIIWSEATSHSERNRSLLRVIFRKLLMKKAMSFIAVSTDAKEYFQRLGASPKQIFIALQTTDVDGFCTKCNLFRKNKEIYKEKLGLKGTKIILYSGQLIKRKGVIYLLRAFLKVSKKYSNLAVLIVGDGPKLNDLKLFCMKHHISDRVIFTGFVQPQWLPKYYAISDLYVFPSLCDTFGVVINEAIAAGLPIVCSKYAGAARDLVKDGGNGYIINPHDVDTLALRMGEILSDEKKRIEMSNKSKEIMKVCTIDQAAQGFMQAISYVLSN